MHRGTVYEHQIASHSQKKKINTKSWLVPCKFRSFAHCILFILSLLLLFMVFVFSFCTQKFTGEICR